MSPNTHNSSNEKSHKTEENSLPTYEEATGKVQPSAPALEPVSANTEETNRNQHFGSSSFKVKRDVERNIQPDQQQQGYNRNTDVGLLVTTIAVECQRARRDTQRRKMMYCLSGIVGIILAVILIVIKKSRY